MYLFTLWVPESLLTFVHERIESLLPDPERWFIRVRLPLGLTLYLLPLLLRQRRSSG